MLRLEKEGGVRVGEKVCGPKALRQNVCQPKCPAPKEELYAVLQSR